MPGLSDSQRAVILTLIDSAPDSAIRSLDLALSAETRTEGPMAAIRDLVSAEAADRRTRGAVFSAFIGLCPTGAPAYPRKTFPSGLIAKLWRALKSAAPGDVAQAPADACEWTVDLPAPHAFHRLFAQAAAGLREIPQSPLECWLTAPCRIASSAAPNTLWSLNGRRSLP